MLTSSLSNKSLCQVKLFRLYYFQISRLSPLYCPNIFLQHSFYMSLLKYIFDLGLLKAVSSSIGFLLDQTDPNLTKTALIEIRLELSEPDVIFRPPIDSNLVGNFSDQIEGYVEDVYQMCALIPRIAAHKATQINKGTPGDTPLDTPDKSYADEVPPDTFDDKNHSVLALKERHYKRVLQEERHGMWIICTSDLVLILPIQKKSFVPFIKLLFP